MRLDRFDWLNQIQEEPVDPLRSIVDPHHHLWDRGGSTYLAAQLQADTGATHQITHTVFVECFAEYRSSGPERLQPLGETEFVVAQAVEAQQLGGSILAGIVAFAGSPPRAAGRAAPPDGRHLAARWAGLRCKHRRWRSPVGSPRCPASRLPLLLLQPLPRHSTSSGHRGRHLRVHLRAVRWGRRE